jgi:hypothetical protein
MESGGFVRRRDTAWAMSEENVELVPPAYSGGDT